MTERRKWNKGICRVSGQPWYHVESKFFRGPSTSWITEIYEDGCGNTLYIAGYSKINQEYRLQRTPEIEAKEKEALNRLADEHFQRQIRNPYVRCFDESGKEIIYTPPEPTPPSKWALFWDRVGLLFAVAITLVYILWTKGCLH